MSSGTSRSLFPPYGAYRFNGRYRGTTFNIEGARYKLNVTSQYIDGSYGLQLVPSNGTFILNYQTLNFSPDDDDYFIGRVTFTANFPNVEKDVYTADVSGPYLTVLVNGNPTL